MSRTQTIDFVPDDVGTNRSANAKSRRVAAAELSADEDIRPKVRITSNGDNLKYPSLPMAFTKGLAHSGFGMVNPATYHLFAKALTTVDRSGKPDTQFKVPTAKQQGVTSSCTVKGRQPDFRQWESPLAGHYFSLEGPDPDAVAMAPAPRLGDSELSAEIAEVYAMAITRDMEFDELACSNQTLYHYDEQGCKQAFCKHDGKEATVQDLVDSLNSLSWFSRKLPAERKEYKEMSADKTDHEMRRQAARGKRHSPGLTADTLFRGSSYGARDGCYLSQFLTLGTGSNPEQGIIGFGAQTISQQVTPGAQGLDYMTSWAEWLDVQNGFNLAGGYPTDTARLMSRPRDLAEYVHVDQLYQAYFNACLIILSSHSSSNNLVERGFPNNHHDTRGAFATFGGPHVLSLLTEVASRALKAVRRQKFQIHRRARPERLAAMLTLVANDKADALDEKAQRAIHRMLVELGVEPAKGQPESELMKWVTDYNKVQNSPGMVARRAHECDASARHDLPRIHDERNFMLPMAFAEGSPMHPSYGAGHATVAGACVTVLKAFFAMTDNYGLPVPMCAIRGGRKDLTLEGELNKLASNISIGRNFAGVHYYSDYYDSLRMGERIAVGILQEQMLNYNEEVRMSWHSFDGETLSLVTQGGHGSRSPVLSVNGDERAASVAAWWTNHVREYDQDRLLTSDIMLADAG